MALIFILKPTRARFPDNLRRPWGSRLCFPWSHVQSVGFPPFFRQFKITGYKCLIRMNSHEDGSREKQTSDNQRGEDEKRLTREAEWMRHRAIKDKEIGKIQVGTFHNLPILNTRDSSATIMALRWSPVPDWELLRLVSRYLLIIETEVVHNASTTVVIYVEDMWKLKVGRIWVYRGSRCRPEPCEVMGNFN